MGVLVCFIGVYVGWMFDLGCSWGLCCVLVFWCIYVVCCYCFVFSFGVLLIDLVGWISCWCLVAVVIDTCLVCLLCLL